MSEREGAKSRLAGCLATVFISVGVGLGVSYFFLTEPVEIPIRIPPAAEVRANPYFAAGAFLEELGLESGFAWAAPKEPSDDLDLLLLLSPQRQPLPRRDQRLLEWVERGGHLVVVARQPDPGESWVEEDPLLEACGVSLEVGQVAGSNQADPEQLSLSFDSSYGLSWAGDEPEWGYLEPGTGYLRALGYRRGAGLITILTDAGPWTNEALRERDHARFLLQTARLRSSRAQPLAARALLVRADSPPSFLGLLWDVAWPCLSALLVWLVVWIVHRAQRFGPILPPPPVARRSLGEHLEAAARFLWRHRAQSSLVEPVREALLDTIRRRRPDLVALGRGAQVEALAELGQVAPGRVEDALYGPPPRSPDRFTQAVTLLERLRRSL